MDHEIKLNTGDRLIITWGVREITFEAMEDSLLVEDGIVPIV